MPRLVTFDRLLICVCAVAMLSCVQPAPYSNNSPYYGRSGSGTTRPALIGTLEVSGQQVFVDGAPAQNGSRVYDGSRVVTNSNSSAIINLVGGGSIQLDQNTDPVFTLLRQGFCILIEIASGQVFEDTPGQCIQFKTPDGSAQSDTKVNLDLRSGRAVWTLAQGQVRFAPPINFVLRPFQQCTISQRRLINVRQVSQQDINSITAWRGRYFRVGPVIGYPPSRPSYTPAPPPPRPTRHPTPPPPPATPAPAPTPSRRVLRYPMRPLPAPTPSPVEIR